MQNNIEIDMPSLSSSSSAPKLQMGQIGSPLRFEGRVAADQGDEDIRTAIDSFSWFEKSLSP